MSIKSYENSSTYKEIVGLLHAMDNQYNDMKEIVGNYVSSQYGVSSNILEAILPITMDYITTEMTNDDAKDFLFKYCIDGESKLNDVIEKTSEKKRNSDTMESDAVIDIMIDIKKHSLDLMNFKAEINDIKEECKDDINDYLLKLSSPVFTEKRRERIENLKKAAESEENENERKKILDMINVMEKTYSLSFLFERLDSLGDKELNKIMEGFFDKQSGSYIINRYKSKIEKFGFSKKLYMYFFNLEENLLPEKYHVFNNLFLFFYMRFVAYRDPYSKNDKLFVQALTSNISNMVYHKDSSSENAFISIVEKVLDKFEPYREKFILDNTTRPGHPVRIESSERLNRERKEAIIKKMIDLKIDVDDSLSADELQKIMNDKVEEMIEAQRIKISNSGKETTTKENDDGSIIIEPNIEKNQTSTTV